MTTKKKKNKSKFEIIKNILIIIGNKIKEIFSNKKVVKVGISVLVVVFIALGFSYNCSYSEKEGLSCSTGYTPPNPDDVRKIIEVGDSAYNLNEARKRVKE